MIHFTTGNIVEAAAEALVNTVNTQGVMGKGIALAFKNAFPKNFIEYTKACKTGDIRIGKLLITETGELSPRYIINFPTKIHWRYPSKLEYIDSGLKDLVRIINEYHITSIAIPPLGSGNGRLNWHDVKQLLSKYLSKLDHSIDIIIFEPGYNDQFVETSKVAVLNPTRAILLYLLKKYQILGYDINLLVIQKIAYFLQRFGEPLNLKFEKGTYGPYAHNLTHLLRLLNNQFIKFNQNNNSPVTLVKYIDTKYDEVLDYYQKNVSDEQKVRVDKVLELIEGFESPYGLELLATIDFIRIQTNKTELAEIENDICNWTQRKKSIMKPYHIQVAYERLNQCGMI